jgi:hypothetical protein
MFDHITLRVADLAAASSAFTAMLDEVVTGCSAPVVLASALFDGESATLAGADR